MSDLFLGRSGVYIERVSLGKGYVSWKVRFPPLARHHPGVKKEYGDLDEACRDVKRHLGEEDVDRETVKLIEERCPGLAWGSGHPSS